MPDFPRKFSHIATGSEYTGNGLSEKAACDTGKGIMDPARRDPRKKGFLRGGWEIKTQEPYTRPGGIGLCSQQVDLKFKAG